MKPEIRTTFFSDKEFFSISPRNYSSQFSQVIALFHFSRKSQNKKFLEFFQLFAAFIEMEKCRLFSAFFVRPARLTAVKKRRETQINAVAALILLRHFKLICFWIWRLVTFIYGVICKWYRRHKESSKRKWNVADWLVIYLNKFAEVWRGFIRFK